MSAANSLTFTARHVQIARALFAAIAAVMITFTSDHSAQVGLAAFSGFAFATALVWGLSAWLVYPQGRRGAPILLAFMNFIAGVVAGMTGARTTTLFFVVLIAWAVLSMIIEGSWGLRERKGEFAGEAKEAIAVAVITAVFAAAMLVIQPGYALNYFNETLQEGGTLTGITIAVGVFGGYAAIVAVYLGIAGFSPKNDALAPDEAAPAQEVSR